MSEETTQLTPITEEETTQLTLITEEEIKENSMSTLPTRPNSNGLYGETKMTPSELKERMDALALLAIDRINKLIGGMQAGGEVAKTIKFQYDEESKEYSLADLFSMIFSNTGLSNILVTSIKSSELAPSSEASQCSEASQSESYVTLNTALENMFTFAALFTKYEESISNYLAIINDDKIKIEQYKDDFEQYENDIEKYKTDIEDYKKHIDEVLDETKNEVNKAFGIVEAHANALAEEYEVTT